MAPPHADCPNAPRSAAARLDAAMDRYVDGDLAAFDELYAGIADRVFTYLLSLVRSRSRAEDLMQLTFMRLHTARHAWARGARVLPYVLAIARNAAYDQFRSLSSSRVLLTQSGDVPELAIPSQDPADNDVSRAVSRALNRLSPRYREAIVLTKQLEMTAREAGKVVGTTETAMKLRVHRAYKQLRRLLSEFAPEVTHEQP